MPVLVGHRDLPESNGASDGKNEYITLLMRNKVLNISSINNFFKKIIFPKKTMKNSYWRA